MMLGFVDLLFKDLCNETILARKHKKFEQLIGKNAHNMYIREVKLNIGLISYFPSKVRVLRIRIFCPQSSAPILLQYSHENGRQLNEMKNCSYSSFILIAHYS